MQKRILLGLSILAVSVIWAKEISSKLVHTAQGPVRGYKDINEDIIVFYGIPYAKAPTGPAKFKAPLPAPTWEKPLEAINQKIACPQHTSPFLPPDITIQEDCLIANVYVPLTEERNLPVMVYIHGGGFILGFGNLITPKKIVASQKIIAVTFNYRLGAHGFLCLGTKDIPGNSGMKDQVALLRWVRQNIASFGGNPDDITIGGFSAGSSSVGLLMLSKTTQGLFNKGILESGDILSPYAMQINPIEVAKEYSHLIGFDNINDVNALEDFFKHVSHEIMSSADIMSRPDSTFLVAPCVERDVGEERFLEDNPIDIIKRGDFPKIPLLSGFATMEGLMRIDIFDEWLEEMNKNFSSFLPADLQFTNNKEREEVAHIVKQFYFRGRPVNTNNVLEYINLQSDMLFTCPALRTTKLLLENGHRDIYYYEYSYVDQCTPKIPYTDVRGPGHCAQTNIVLDEPPYSNCTDDNGFHQSWKSLMQETWLNFIIKGKPETARLPEWPAARIDSFKYMDLNQNSSVKESLLQKRCSFWDEIYDKFYQKPLPPVY